MEKINRGQEVEGEERKERRRKRRSRRSRRRRGDEDVVFCLVHTVHLPTIEQSTYSVRVLLHTYSHIHE